MYLVEFQETTGQILVSVLVDKEKQSDLVLTVFDQFVQVEDEKVGTKVRKVLFDQVEIQSKYDVMYLQKEIKLILNKVRKV